MDLLTTPNDSTVLIEEQICETCLGEGSILVTDGPGQFDERMECFVPREEHEPCPDCRAHGRTYRVRLRPPASVEAEPDLDKDDLPF